MKRCLASLGLLVSTLALAIPIYGQQTTTGTITLRGTPAGPARVDIRAMNPEDMKKTLVARFEQRFDDADEDGDGSLSKEEFKKMSSSTNSSSMAVQGKESQPSSADSQTGQKSKLTEKQRKEREKALDAQFDKLDSDDDGMIAKEEFVDARSSAMSNALGDQDNRQNSDNSSNSTSTTSTRAIRLGVP